MLEVLDFLVKNIVKNKEDVKIEEKHEGKTTVLTVTVNSQDMGAVIGKSGATATAIRTIVKSLSSHQRVVVKFNS